MKNYLITTFMPPLGACCYACGTNCAAPITVFWLFGVISVVYGFMGGPLQLETTSWYTVGLGFIMWSISAVWALLSVRGVEEDQCQSLISNRKRHVEPILDESDPLEEVKRA